MTQLARPPLSAPFALSMIAKLRGRLWSKQVDVTKAVFGHWRTTVVPANTGAGKSFVAAYIAWAWLMGAPGRLVLTTAPTTRQVNGAVWKAMRAIHKQAELMGMPLGGKMTPKSPSWEGPNGRSAIGYSSSDPVNYAGWHSPGGTLVIVDDAQGIDDATWDTLQATLTGENDRMLALANPVMPAGRFFEYCTTTGGKVVKRIPISAFDSPNVKAGRTIIDGMATVESINNIREVFGEDSAVWKSRVLGQFPDADDAMTLVPLSWLEHSRQEYNAWQPELEGVLDEYRVLAADLAGLGVDHGISAVVRDYLLRDVRGIPFRARVGDPLLTHPKFPVENTMGTVGHLVQQHRALSPNSFRVDMVGMGMGIHDRLRELGLPVVGMNGGRASSDPKSFLNERAEVLYAFREALRPKATDGGADDRPVVMLPWNDRLVQQATTLRMSFTSSGQTKMESKKEWAARQSSRTHTSTSPDELDAMAMALCAEPAGTGSIAAKWAAAYGS